MDHSFWKQHEYVNLSDTDCEDVITSSFVYQCMLQQSVRMPTIICKAVFNDSPSKSAIHFMEKKRKEWHIWCILMIYNANTCSEMDETILRVSKM